MTESRVALVTGASRGIGRAVAARLAEEGYDLVLHAHGPDAVRRTAEELADKYAVTAVATSGDIAEAATTTAMVRTAFERFRRLDALVVNAGTHAAGMLGMLDEASVARLFAVNAVGATHTLQGAVRLLARGRAPAVVLVSSVTATHGTAGQAVYAASKAAVAGLARSAAKELGPRGIRVNAVAPGFIVTEQSARSRTDPAHVAAVSARTPMGRWGQPEDIAGPVLFLASPAAGFMTGTCLAIDGGYSIV